VGPAKIRTTDFEETKYSSR